jgi:hypothetical protein
LAGVEKRDEGLLVTGGERPCAEAHLYRVVAVTAGRAGGFKIDGGK